MRTPQQRGFTLIEIVVAVAVTLTLVGLAVPVAFRAVEIAEEQKTRSKLAAFEQGLLAFYRDHGRFPKGSEGLASLLSDPGTSQWRGPYVSTAGSVGEMLQDSRGADIEYEQSGATVRLSPGSFADIELRLDASTVVAEWAVRARREIAALNDAAEGHRSVIGVYPATVADLVPTRLGADYAIDPWGRDYVVQSDRQFFYSRGPDGLPGNTDDVLAPGL